MNKKLTKQKTKGGNSFRAKTLTHQISWRKQICQAKSKEMEGRGGEGREVTSQKEEDGEKNKRPNFR